MKINQVTLAMVAAATVTISIVAASSANAEPVKQLGAHNCGTSNVGIQAQVSSLPGDEAQFFVTPVGKTRVYFGFTNGAFKYQTHVFNTTNVSSSGYMADKIGSGLAFCS
ncbi:hypothetical protein [Curtobacterium sp. PsM8]|uniref:hypothetical protein n=1 Tax=Curtobacterium sp. PsM8 TaxID=3030532 RepID=UPI00263A948E|nr:hypothetical protein [Curtobacterium sp. PsM8]MDN4648500.1 hypothetical protein [Curtobacterium sp. PsM8]